MFCASLADVFDNQAPSEWRNDLFALIRECRRLNWLMLTKRPQNIDKMLPADWGDGYRNVWLGVTPKSRSGLIADGAFSCGSLPQFGSFPMNQQLA